MVFVYLMSPLSTPKIVVIFAKHSQTLEADPPSKDQIVSWSQVLAETERKQQRNKTHAKQSTSSDLTLDQG